MHTKHTRISDGFFHVDLKTRDELMASTASSSRSSFGGCMKNWKVGNPKVCNMLPWRLGNVSFKKGAFWKGKYISRWWQLKYFECSSRTLGKMNPFWRTLISTGLVQPPTSDGILCHIPPRSKKRHPFELICLSTCELKCADGSRSQLHYIEDKLIPPEKIRNPKRMGFYKPLSRTWVEEIPYEKWK